MGPRVASPNDNFIFFGANCKEDHKVVQIFTKELLSDIARIEKLPFHLNLYHLT